MSHNNNDNYSQITNISAQPNDDKANKLRTVGRPAPDAIAGARTMQQQQEQQRVAFEEAFQLHVGAAANKGIRLALKRLEDLSRPASRSRFIQDNINFGLNATSQLLNFIEQYEKAGADSAIQNNYQAVYQQACRIRDTRLPSVMHLVRRSLAEITRDVRELNQNLVSPESERTKNRETITALSRHLENLGLPLIQRNIETCQAFLSPYVATLAADNPLRQAVTEFARRLERRNKVLKNRPKHQAVLEQLELKAEDLQAIKDTLLKLQKKLDSYTSTILNNIKDEVRLRKDTINILEGSRENLMNAGLVTEDFKVNTTMHGYQTLSKQVNIAALVSRLNEVITLLDPDRARLKQIGTPAPVAMAKVRAEYLASAPKRQTEPAPAVHVSPSASESAQMHKPGLGRSVSEPTLKNAGRLTVQQRPSVFMQDLEADSPLLARVLKKVASFVGLAPKMVASKVVETHVVAPRAETAASAAEVIHDIQSLLTSMYTAKHSISSRSTLVEKDEVNYNIDQALTAAVPLISRLKSPQTLAVLPKATHTQLRTAAALLDKLDVLAPQARDFGQLLNDTKRAVDKLEEARSVAASVQVQGNVKTASADVAPITIHKVHH